jgi:uncharacterized membrane protein YfcA
MAGGWLDLALLSLATFAGASIQAATGFGFAILAAPVFLGLIASKSAVPILVALHVVQSAVLLVRLRTLLAGRSPPLAAFGRLMLGGAVGCPLGYALYRLLDLGQLKLAAGIVILAVTGMIVVRRWRHARAPALVTPRRLAPDATAFLGLTGTLSGALTALLVMPGPPLMVALMLRPAEPAVARAISLAFFAACYVLVLAMSIVGGDLDAAAWTWVAHLVPAVVAGTLAGLALARHVDERRFGLVVLVLLVAAGAGAILSAL